MHEEPDLTPIPADDFAGRYDELLDEMGDVGGAIRLTRDGRSDGVVLAAGDYDRLIERCRVLTAIAEGLADSAAGRVHDHEVVMAELRARLDATSKDDAAPDRTESSSARS